MFLVDIDNQGQNSTIKNKICGCNQYKLGELDALKVCCVYSEKEPQISEENTTILNALVAQVTRNFTTSLLEFVDILLEDLMYPRGVSYSVYHLNFENKQPFEECSVSDLGNTSILDVIHIRKLILEVAHELESSSKFEIEGKCENIIEYGVFLQKMEKIHVGFVLLLKKLSSYLEIPNSFEYFKNILQKNLGKFKSLFGLFKIYKEILLILIESAHNFESIEERNDVQDNEEEEEEEEGNIFKVKEEDLEKIKKFTIENTEWLHKILHKSKSYEEYLESHQDDKKVKFDDIEFKNFLQQRKSSLKISSRKL